MIYDINAMCSHMCYKHDELRDTLLHKDYTHWKECSKACKGLIYQAVQENVTYFRPYQHCEIGITLNLEDFIERTFAEMYEFTERFSNAVKGFFGRDFDNLQPIYLATNNKMYSLSLICNYWKPTDTTETIFSLWDIEDDTKCYYSVESTRDRLSKEELQQIKVIIKGDK